MRALLYGPTVDAIGRHIEMEAAEDRSIARVRDHLGSMHPNPARSIDGLRVTIGNVVSGEDHRINASGVELLLPVPGR